MARDRAGVDVVAAAGVAADDEFDGPAGVVVLRHRGRSAERGGDRAGDEAGQGLGRHERHFRLPDE